MKLQELHEAAVYGKDLQIENKSVEDAIDILNKHCKNALWMLHTNKPIWRGHRHDLKDFSVIDTTKSERVSNNTYNHYTAIFDSSPLMRGWPKRSKSLICSTKQSRAQGYAMHEDDWLFAVIPFDSAKIGAVNSEDIWDTTVTIGGIKDRISGWNVVWNHLGAYDDITGLKGLAAKMRRGKYDDVKVVNADKPFPPEVRKDLMSAIYDAYDPKKLGFTLCDSRSVRNAKVGEVWVGGKVMMIKRPMWVRVRKAYKELMTNAGLDDK